MAKEKESCDKFFFNVRKIQRKQAFYPDAKPLGTWEEYWKNTWCKHFGSKMYGEGK